MRLGRSIVITSAALAALQAIAWDTDPWPPGRSLEADASGYMLRLALEYTGHGHLDVDVFLDEESARVLGPKGMSALASELERYGVRLTVGNQYPRWAIGRYDHPPFTTFEVGFVGGCITTDTVDYVNVLGHRTRVPFAVSNWVRNQARRIEDYIEFYLE